MQRRWTASGVGPAILTDTPEMQAQMQTLNDSLEKPSLPRMGVFGPPGQQSCSANSKASAVIEKQTMKWSIPSPFAKLTRSRRPGGDTTGEGTSTTACSPVRGRKRSVTVSARLLSRLSTHSSSSLPLTHRFGLCSQTSRRSSTSALCGFPRRAWTCLARSPRRTCTPCLGETSSPRAPAACSTCNHRRACPRTA